MAIGVVNSSDSRQAMWKVKFQPFYIGPEVATVVSAEVNLTLYCNPPCLFTLAKDVDI